MADVDLPISDPPAPSFEPPNNSIGGIQMPRSKTTWLIIIAVGVIVGYVIYRKFKANEGIDSGVGTTYGWGSGGGGGDSDVPAAPSPITSPTGTKYADNNEWAQAAIWALVEHGTNGVMANIAIQKYILGTALSEAETSLVNAAIGYIGPPPEVPGNVSTAPTGDTPTTSTIYIVKPGDTLSKIAAKYGIDWRSLYEVNKAVIGSNANLIKPGQRLVIPAT